MNFLLYLSHQPKRKRKMKEYPMNQPLLFKKLKEVFDTITAISGKKILVIRELEVALMLAVKNSVIYITDDPDCAEIFRKNTDAGMGDDDQVIINNLDKKFKLEEVTGDMKFDCAILNPPYDRNLHLKILEQVIAKADKVVNISPVRWLQDPFAPYSTRSDYCKFEDSVSKKIETLDVIPADKARELFDANMQMALGIYICGNGGYDYTFKDGLINKIVQKTMEHSWMPFNQRDFYKAGCNQVKPFALNVGAVNGDLRKIMSQDYNHQITVTLTNRTSVFTGGAGVSATHFEFDTEEERKNFHACYNHPFMLWHIAQWKTDVNIKAWKVPYFDDYSHPWDYADFFAWFDLTKEEQERVMREIAETQVE